MRLIDEIMRLTGKPEECCCEDCPYNHDEIVLKTDFSPRCGGDEEDCESCLNQEIDKH